MNVENHAKSADYNRKMAKLTLSVAHTLSHTIFGCCISIDIKVKATTSLRIRCMSKADRISKN